MLSASEKHFGSFFRKPEAIFLFHCSPISSLLSVCDQAPFRARIGPCGAQWQGKAASWIQTPMGTEKRVTKLENDRPLHKNEILRWQVKQQGVNSSRPRLVPTSKWRDLMTMMEEAEKAMWITSWVMRQNNSLYWVGNNLQRRKGSPILEMTGRYTRMIFSVGR